MWSPGAVFLRDTAALRLFSLSMWFRALFAFHIRSVMKQASRNLFLMKVHGKMHILFAYGQLFSFPYMILSVWTYQGLNICAELLYCLGSEAHLKIIFRLMLFLSGGQLVLLVDLSYLIDRPFRDNAKFLSRAAY